MAKGFGDKDRKYDPTDPDAVKKIKSYITKKLKEGWILYGGKAGQKDLDKIANVNDIDKEVYAFTRRKTFGSSNNWWIRWE